MAPIRDSVSHSPNQTGLEHPGLDSQYEPSPWSSGSPCSSDSNSNWGKVLVDGSTDKSNNPCSTSSSVWPPSSSSFSCSSSSSSSGCGSGSDPELASECMDADSSSSVGSEKNLSTVAANTVMMMSANASSSVSSTASSPTSSLGASTMMVGVTVNGDGNNHQVIGGGLGAISGANNGNIPGSSHYSMAGSSSIGSNNMSNHNNKIVGGSGVWGAQSGSNMNATGGSNPCVNGGLNPNTLNPNANHGAWPQNQIPSPVCQGQRPSQAQGMSSKLVMAPQQGLLLGWGGMAAPDNSSMMEDAEANNGTSSSKVLGGSNSGNSGLPPTNLNTESNGPNNTILMNTTTTTNTTMTSSPPNSTASPQLSGDCSWGSIGGGNGGPLANGNLLSAPQHPQGELGSTGAFGTPWGAATYLVDKGPQNADTVNPQISSTAAFKSNNNHNNTGAPRWDQGPTNNLNQPQSNLSWGVGSNQIPGSVGQTPGNGNQTTIGPPAGIPCTWGSSASSSSSSSSSSTSNNKMSNGDWGSTTSSNNHSDAGSQKESSANNGWRSLEDDAMGMGGGGGGGGGSHGLGNVTGGWGRSGGSEGSGESSGGRSSSDRDSSQSKGGNRRKGNQSASVISALTQADVDPRVLSNTGWGQTPIRQNTVWDVNSPNNQQQGPRGDERKQSKGGSSWSTAAPAAPSQTSAGWGGGPSSSGPDSGGSGWGDQRQTSGWDSKVPSNGGGGQSGWDDGSSYKGSNNSNTWSNNIKDDRSNTWTNTHKLQQSRGSSGGNGSETWAGGADGSRSGASNHWGEPQKGAGSVGWDSDSDRSGSGCWSEPSRTNTSSSNTWVGSGGSNTPDQSTPNAGSNWGDSVHKSNPQSNSQNWGEPMKNNQGSQNWGGPNSKPSNEWGKGPESNMSRGNQGSNKPTGWLGGPIPTVGQKEEVATGWEEPSPESIRRRMEIDDGTAAWGDPGKYGSGAVNMWNRTSQSDQETMGPFSQSQSHSVHSSMQHQNEDKSCSSGWSEPYPQQKDSSSWGEPTAGPPVTVDNGTSAWGKPVDSNTGWNEPSRDSTESGSRWGTQHKSGPSTKPMETWCGEDVSMSNSWDQEEEVEIGMWSNSQQDNRSHDQNTWNYKNKGSNRMSKPVNKQDEPWMKPFINQFNNMNFSRDSPDDSMKTGAGMVTDKRMDMSSMGDFNGVMGKNPGSRQQLHKESAMDRSPYYDKNVNSMLGGSSVAQGRGGPQSQPPPQPNLRNQVPPPILPSQVPPSLLKYPGGNGGLNPLFGPQQVAVLNQLSQLNKLSQLNQINQLQRLLLQQQQQQQQQKAQNQRAMPVGRQTEQTRPIGSSPSMMQPPRHLDPSLLKQVPPLKPYQENYLSQNNPEMQKDAPTLGSFSNFPLSLNSNLNVPLDMGIGGGSSGGGAVSYKEPPQSRLKSLWATEPLEQNSKTGAISSGLRLEDSPFYDFLSPGPSPLSPPGQSMGSVGDGWPPRANSPPPHGNTVTWPPEFRPGEPWKGYPNIDPETDPYVTPGSVINNLSINTVRDTDHLRDRNIGPSSSLNTTMPSNSAWSSIRASSHSGSLTSTAQSTSARPSESKWSPGSGSVSSSSLAHELWKVPLPPKALPVAAPSRPPPGLTSQKPSPAPSGWDGSALRLGSWSSTESRYTPGSSWGESSSSGRTQWLVLKNLTPQIDGSTLRTLCMQHGPLITFHLNLPHGNAVVCYSSKDEAAKAQKSLHMCVLGNTTILAEFASEEEISRFFAQGQSLASPSSGWQAIGSSQSRMDQPHPFPSRAPEPNQWSSSDLHGSSLWGRPNYSSSLWGSPSGTESGRISSPSPISSFLPMDHLTGGGDSM
ncbi:trinucleotide repeat-containing gene 6A protein-like [Melanotaenia boesemani]|uniref:trinucleotide repeat-containing gene 6A protein-like n=1 Tax=Melanotaenia boesemani TaxID=1250792 RepID=UPI001C046F72|nr:trinucleotide repeat-containing gene 6A protein-like [Melanotaenia boesemani]XP_041854461.1 trinucleotide repeat-containing gene 6A protein-like [Melanotaenia boesemani]